jgi:hypothetical protein
VKGAQTAFGLRKYIDAIVFCYVLNFMKRGRPKLTHEEKRITASFALPRQLVLLCDHHALASGLSRSAWLTRFLSTHVSAPLHPNSSDSRAAE